MRFHYYSNEASQTEPILTMNMVWGRHLMEYIALKLWFFNRILILRVREINVKNGLFGLGEKQYSIVSIFWTKSFSPVHLQFYHRLNLLWEGAKEKLRAHCWNFEGGPVKHDGKLTYIKSNQLSASTQKCYPEWIPNLIHLWYTLNQKHQEFMLWCTTTQKQKLLRWEYFLIPFCDKLSKADKDRERSRDWRKQRQRKRDTS